MEVLEQLLKKNSKNNHEDKQKRYLKEDEEDEMYMEQKEKLSINQNKGIFTIEKQAINTDENIFDSKAVFRTHK